jgi:hypothetical protein
MKHLSLLSYLITMIIASSSLASEEQLETKKYYLQLETGAT